MKTIFLTQDKITLVDDAYYDWLMQWRWHATKNGSCFYAARNGPKIHGKRRPIYMHREIMGAESGQEVDHINVNSLDNRQCNLRLCVHRQNLANQRSQTGSSQFKGVSWSKQNRKWHAQIIVDYKKIHLGCYSNETEAARAYNQAALEHFGEFANINDLGVS